MKKILVSTMLALVISSAFAQDKVTQSAKLKQDIADCNKQGEAAANEALKKTPVQSPADVTFVKEKTKRDEVNKCMRAAGYATGPIRAK